MNRCWKTFLPIACLMASVWTSAQVEVSSIQEVYQLAGGKVYVLIQKDKSYSIDSARYAVYIPHGVDTIRGVFVHQHGCTMEGRGLSTAFDIQYQAFAQKWKLAVVGPDLFAQNNCHDWKNPSSGSGVALFKTLRELGTVTRHTELADAPLLLWGHSGGGYWVQAMMKEYPKRIMAVFSYSPGLQADWDYPQAALKIPALIRHAGPEGDACCWETALRTFRQLREPGGYAGIAYTRHQHHNYSYVRYMAIPFFEAVMKQRLPDGAKAGYLAMRDMDSTKAWLGDTASYNIYKAAAYPGKKLAAAWFPDSLTAVKWREYVITGTVIDRTPPPAPYDLQMKRRHNVTVEISWKADADIESGISHFNIYKGNQLVARFPGSGTYQQFDTNGDDAYPLLPPEMRTDVTLLWNDPDRISITTVNQFGLESEKTIVP